MPGLFSFFVFQLGSSDISEEKMEEYRMLSGFKPKEIVRIRKLFLKLTSGTEELKKEVFDKIECIALSPLQDRICLIFGFGAEKQTLDFQEFLCGLALFNAPGMKEQKLRVVFRIQDFDGDGIISKADLTQYMSRITRGNLSESEIGDVVKMVFEESASDAQLEQITFTDFQRVVAHTDFQAKLQLLM